MHLPPAASAWVHHLHIELAPEIPEMRMTCLDRFQVGGVSGNASFQGSSLPRLLTLLLWLSHINPQWGLSRPWPCKPERIRGWSSTTEGSRYQLHGGNMGVRTSAGRTPPASEGPQSKVTLMCASQAPRRQRLAASSRWSTSATVEDTASAMACRLAGQPCLRRSSDRHGSLQGNQTPTLHIKVQ